MKILLIVFFVAFIRLSCFSQEFEFCGSLNTSSEKRFQSAYGIGVQYNQAINTKFKVGLGVHYNFKNVNFEDISHADWDPYLIISDKINSSSRRFSIRLNIQRFLLSNKNVSLSLGPETSYNYFWGKDIIDERRGQNAVRYFFTNKTGLTKEIGFGLISKIEIKHIIKPKLSLCFTIRPEFTTDGKFVKGGKRIFSGVLGFAEFQLGLKYRIRE